MQKFTTLADCVRLAEFAHFNQQDKAGFPYIKHPLRVMASVQEQGAAPYIQMGAVLHDVTEDTAFTCDMLLNLGVPDAAVEIVRLMDRDESLRTYKTLLDVSGMRSNPPQTADEFYYTKINANPGARQVKLADIHDNLQEWRLSYLPVEKQRQLKDKYAKALEILT